MPINTLVYAGIAPEKNNAVSGIVNLSRNMGGDVGIAFVTTTIARRAQLHQTNLAAHASNYDPSFVAQMHALAARMQQVGATGVDASRRALAVAYRQLIGQAVTLAYLDVLKMLAYATAFMLPLLLLTRKPKGGAAMGH